MTAQRPHSSDAAKSAHDATGAIGPAEQPASGRLVLVGTPIGNLSDLSPRALAALQEADVILAEDTRVTRKLATRFELTAPLERFDENIARTRIPAIRALVASGRTAALVSDAGMPCVSDPGQNLVDALRSDGLPVEVIPGPSAVLTALAGAGLINDHFYFGGFLPRKDARRRTTFAGLFALDATLVFFESPHRIVASLQVAAEVFPHRRGVVARELTKVHEEFIRLPLKELAAEFEQREQEAPLKGEFVLLIEGSSAEAAPEGAELEQLIEEAIDEALAAGESPSHAARSVASKIGITKNAAYERILARTR